jgi:hypothetical protein
LRKRRSTVRQPVMAADPRRSVVKFIVMLALVGAGVVAMIFFGFPLIEDLVRGVDPSLRYQPQVEAEYVEDEVEEADATLVPTEVYLSDFKIKNEPYIYDNKMVFTSQRDRTGAFQLDTAVLYDMETETSEVLEGIEKKYDNLLSPVMSDNIIILLDSRAAGGGRIIGYDLDTDEQFLVKEYAYAMPKLSVAGDLLCFMQWAGDAAQRLYLYDITTREEATIKLFETEIGNSAADISMDDMVWSEYGSDGSGTFKRIVFEGDTSRYENYEFGNKVFEPKTNGKDVIFATERDIVSGSLMLSTNGGSPVKIAENVINYDLGNGYIAYTKEDKVYVHYTNAQDAIVMTSDIAQNILASVSGNVFCYYDITDIDLLDEVVLYAYAS